MSATLGPTPCVGVKVGADIPHWPAPTLSCRYNLGSNPKRVLTKPSVGVKNDGYDNENSDLILYVNDVLINHQPSSNICRKYAIQVCEKGAWGIILSLNLQHRESRTGLRNEQVDGKSAASWRT